MMLPTRDGWRPRCISIFTTCRSVRRSRACCRRSSYHLDEPDFPIRRCNHVPFLICRPGGASTARKSCSRVRGPTNCSGVIRATRSFGHCGGWIAAPAQFAPHWPVAETGYPALGTAPWARPYDEPAECSATSIVLLTSGFSRIAWPPPTPMLGQSSLRKSLNHSAASRRTRIVCTACLAIGDLGEVDRFLERDLTVYLPNHNLLYTDKMGMAVGIEARVPLLDQELVELGTSLSPVQKLDPGPEGDFATGRAEERCPTKLSIGRKPDSALPIDPGCGTTWAQCGTI